MDNALSNLPGKVAPGEDEDREDEDQKDRHEQKGSCHMPRTAKQYAERVEEMWATADQEGRDLSLEERSELENILEHMKSQHSLEKSMNEVQKPRRSHAVSNGRRSIIGRPRQ